MKGAFFLALGFGVAQIQGQDCVYQCVDATSAGCRAYLKEVCDENPMQYPHCKHCFPTDRGVGMSMSMPSTECITEGQATIARFTMNCGVSSDTGFVSADVPCLSSGNVKIRVTGEQARQFGVMNREECVQTCLPPSELRYIGGYVEGSEEDMLGSCEELGFTILRRQTSVQSEMAPMPLPLSIFRKPQPDSYNCVPGREKVALLREYALEYGATTIRECAEICVPPESIDFITGAKKAMCKQRGYMKYLRDTSVSKMGMEVDVKIYGIMPVKRIPPPAPKGITCAPGTLNIIVTAPEVVSDYGGSNMRGAKECVEVCLDPALVAEIRDARLGSCVELGYVIWKGDNLVRSANPKIMQGEVTASLFTIYRPECPRLLKPFVPTKCPKPIRLGWYMNAFSKCIEAIGCGVDRRSYQRKLFRTKGYCEKAALKYC